MRKSLILLVLRLLHLLQVQVSNCLLSISKLFRNIQRDNQSSLQEEGIRNIQTDKFTMTIKIMNNSSNLKSNKSMTNIITMVVITRVLNIHKNDQTNQ